MGLDIHMRRSILFFALCSALDEASTFIHLSIGGSELNPRVSRLIGVHPLLYPFFDVVLILLSWVFDKTLRNRVRDLWLVWASAGIARLICLGYSLF